MFRPVPAALVLAALASAANAQVLVPTGQTRELRGESSWTDQFGTNTFGPLVIPAPVGGYGHWTDFMSIPGFIAGTIAYTGGFDFIDTITLESVTFSLGGGNGAGTSASASAEIEFTYTFDLPSPVTYFTSATFGVAAPSVVPDTFAEFSGVYTLTGPGGEVFRYQTGPDNGYNVAVMDATGNLPAGSYTLSFILAGEASFVSPPDDPDGNGVGGGGGGPSPILTFRVEPGVACPADWDDDGAVNSNDISAFLSAWLDSVQNGSLIADFDGSGGVNSNDISAFLSAWLIAVGEGC